MTIADERLIGTDEILPVIKKLYRIGTWRGAQLFIKKSGIPMCRTGSKPREGKPLIFVRDIIEHELKHGRQITVDDILLK